MIVQHPHGVIYVNARLKRNGNNTSSVKEIKNAMQRTRVKSFSIIPTLFTIFELDLHFDVCFAPVKCCERSVIGCDTNSLCSRRCLWPPFHDTAPHTKTDSLSHYDEYEM